MPTQVNKEQEQQNHSINSSNENNQQSNDTGLPDDLKIKLETQSGLDLSGVRVYYNSPLPTALGAHAFTRGMNIYIASGAEKYLPEEGIHLLQQLQGQVKSEQSLTNGTDNVSINESNSLETEAVTTGNQLDKAPLPNAQPTHLKKPTAPTEEIVQRATKSSHYGDFTVDDAKYDFDAAKTKLDFLVDFKPKADVDATKVGLSQLVRNKKNGTAKALEPNQQTKMTDDGYRIDQLAQYPNPLYATGGDLEAGGDASKLEDYKTSPSWGQHAIKGAGGWTQNATLDDSPTINGGNNSSKEFETSAVVLEGGDKGEYYGSVKWGWKKDGRGNLSKIAFDLVSEGAPTKDFLEAAEKWNDGKTRGTIKAKADDTIVYDRDKTTELFKVTKGTKASNSKNYSKNNIQFNLVKILDGTHKNKTGYTKAVDFEDSKDGKDTVNLPLPGIKLPTEDKLNFGAQKDICLPTDPLLSLDTRMKVLEEDGEMAKVEIVQGPKTGDQGWVEKSKLKDE